MLKFLLIFAFISSGFCKNLQQFEPRLFDSAITTTVTEFKTVTTVMPSSCVYAEATLPLCRNVRFMKFPKLSKFFGNNDDVVDKLRTESGVFSTPLSWGEYFGLYAPTVTVTATEINVATVYDPRTVVTFAIKGCKPLKIPGDLDKCPVNEETSSIYIEELLTTVPTVRTIPSQWFTPTSTQVTAIYATEIYQADNGTPQEDLSVVEGSTESIVDDLGIFQATESLQ